jgi:hypothetical protein
MYLVAVQEWEARLLGYAAVAGIGIVASLVIQRAQRNAARPSTTVDDVKRAAETVTGVTVAIFGGTVVLIAFLFIVGGAPPWLYMLLVPVAAWAAWWLPARNRRTTSQSSIIVQGLPTRVSAFVADAPGHVKWSPGVVSCVPEMAGPRGPRFREVEQTADGQQVAGVLDLTRDEPGVAVDFLIAGTGSSGDYYTFAAEPGGTLVNKRTVIELPYLVALAGGMLMARGQSAAAHQRRVNELQALKMAFESGQ